MLLEGVFLPVTTPFHPDGRVFLRKIESNAARYSLTPAAGLLVLGPAGEPASLTDRETEDVLRATARATADDKVLLAAIGRESVAATLRWSEAAAKAGYDAITLQGPEFTCDPAMRREVETYFRCVADRSPLPVVLISSARRPLGYERIAELASHPNIIGSINEKATAERVSKLLALTSTVFRDVIVTPVFSAVTGRMLRQPQAAGNFVSAASLGSANDLSLTPPKMPTKTRTRRVGFQVLAGATGNMLEPWGAGAFGAVPRLGACAPQACCEVWQAFKDGDPALAAEKQDRVRSAGSLLEGARGIPLLKYGCDLNGYFGGSSRLPLLPLQTEERLLLEEALSGMKN